MENILFDPNNKINNQIVFDIKEDGSGIHLKAVSIDDELWEVKKTIHYTSWGIGINSSGMHQIGLYFLENTKKQTSFAIIKDTKVDNVHWKIFLVTLVPDAQAMKQYLSENNEYGLIFSECIPSLD